MLDCKIMTSSSSLSPIPINVLSSECYGMWEHETLNPISTKLEVTDIMEFIDPSTTPTILSSASSSPPSPQTTSITVISSNNNHNCSNESNNHEQQQHCHHSHNSNNRHCHSSMNLDDHFQQSILNHHNLHESNNNNNNNNNNNSNTSNHNSSSYSSSHYLTPLPSLIMHGEHPYSPSEVHMLESFNCIGNSDSVFHKLDTFADSYDFLSEESQHHIPGLPSHLQNSHQHSQMSPDHGHHVPHHQQSQNHGSTSNNSNHVLGGSNATFQFSEPTLLSHQQNHHHPHSQHFQHSSSFHSNPDYHAWDDQNCYPADYRFICKGQSPSTSDAVSYTSIDSGIDCSKSSTESVSTSTSESQRKEKRRVGRPPKKDKKLKRLEKKTGRLWEFIRDLLKNPEYCPSLVRWENPEEGHFRFVNSDQVAKLWGGLKGNPRMTYEKLSRAMRYYYKSHVFEPVLGRRLVYKFGYNATNWRPINPNFSQKIFC